MARWIALTTSMLLVACSGAAAPQPQPPQSTRTDAPPTEPLSATATPFLVPGAVPAPPADCNALLEHAPSSPAERESVCGTNRYDSLEALASALSSTDASRRDTGLAKLEACEAFPAGVVRALRADLAPVACADALIAPFLARPPTDLSPEVHDALLGLAYAGELARLVRHPPVIQPPFSKTRFAEFLRGPLGSWVLAQAEAINTLALEGDKLDSYGKGVAAVEAGMADMRFVEVVREVPLPEELARDKELSDTYYMALDEALEPRKDRGRDAALVGLCIFAELGVLHDRRVDRARALLSKLYSGRRIDRLDGLLLPRLPTLDPHTPEERLAALLPTFYSGLLLKRADATRPTMLRALLERGIPRIFQDQLAGRPLVPETRRLYARALVGLGQRYWRSSDFVRAAQFSDLGSDDTAAFAEEARLLSALARALKAGPRSAAEMMLRGPFLPEAVGNVAGLDELAAGRSSVAALAAYDAAFILEMVPPPDSNSDYWAELAERFEEAATRLEDPDPRALAIDHARAAAETARALREQPTADPNARGQGEDEAE